MIKTHGIWMVVCAVQFPSGSVSFVIVRETGCWALTMTDGNVFISIHAYSRLFFILTLMFTYFRARGRCERPEKKRKGKEELIESRRVEI